MLHVQRLYCYLQDEVPAAEELDLSSMPVDDSYDGPTMEGEQLPCMLLMGLGMSASSQVFVVSSLSHR